MEYNWSGKLRSATFGATDEISLKYDPMGNRVYKTSKVGQNTTKQRFIVDIAGKLPTILCVIDADDGSLERSYIYAGAQPIAFYEGDWSDPAYFYLHDRIGSVRQVLDESGDVKNTYTYTPFGQDPNSQFAETVDNPFMFTGQWYDSEIAQYYLRARMYDPQLMRLTARDPVFGKRYQPLSLHKYLYCLNDPVNRVDLTGKLSFAEILFSNSLAVELRKMDYKFHKSVLDKAEGWVDAFSVMNLKRGLTYDVIIADFEGGLKTTVRDSGIAGLGLISDNFSTLAHYVGYTATVWDNKQTLLDIFKGEGDAIDYYDITNAILGEIVSGL